MEGSGHQAPHTQKVHQAPPALPPPLRVFSGQVRPEALTWDPPWCRRAATSALGTNIPMRYTDFHRPRLP